MFNFTETNPMKTIFTSILLTICILAQAQPYESIFGETSTRWTLRCYNLPGPFNADVWVSGDTTLDGLVYKRFISDVPAGSEVPIVLREDLATGKVWFRLIDDYFHIISDEALAFDFSLEVGDTFNLTDAVTAGSGHTIGTVDSVRYIGGRKHIYFDLLHANGDEIFEPEPITFIEGIGSNVSPISKVVSTLLQGQYLLCSYKDEVQTDYFNKRFAGNCSPVLSLADKINIENSCNVYPNPASNNVHISGLSNKRKTIKLLRLNGTKQLEITNEETNINLPVSHVSQGLYILEISEAGRPAIRKKITIIH